MRHGACSREKKPGKQDLRKIRTIDHVADRSRISLDLNTEIDFAYDTQEYDDIPTYDWGETFDISDFAHAIDRSNDELWAYMKAAICRKLGIPARSGGYAYYSTRRIRRYVYGPDLTSVQEKQITIPVCTFRYIPVKWALCPEHTAE